MHGPVPLVPGQSVASTTLAVLSAVYLFGGCENKSQKTDKPTLESKALQASQAKETKPTPGSATAKLSVPDCPYKPVQGSPEPQLVSIAKGFDRPVFVVGDPTHPDRLFVVEQYKGLVQVLEPGADVVPADTDYFLKLEVNTKPNEMGFLGFAFHPNYPTDPRVYVNYNPADKKRTIVSEFRIDLKKHTALPNSERILLDIEQPYGNHNGGMIEFGADGFLYVGTGDGGAADDPHGHGQNTKSLLGKILRIDVNPSENHPYTIPEDNPFANDKAFLPEIWAYGLRNPWRFSHDSATGQLYVADVGQNLYEEVAIVSKGSNHGWNTMEGFHCFAGSQCESALGPNVINKGAMTMPIYEYKHDVGQSITGGYVYRSCEVPDWNGDYYFADFASRKLFAIHWDGTEAIDLKLSAMVEGNPSSFGSNAWGDVFVTTFGSKKGEGQIWKLQPNRKATAGN